ncbi:hypothetical protein ACF09H_22270 [Streptomyces sp. NPDC014983]|uniref:hypothetical protein n=1 Tax=Streptomyces sp. NPDC014983 TaxID=3364933 RepID=UPI0036F5E78D
MRPLTPVRIVFLSAVATTCLVASVGTLIGAATNGPGAAVASALISGCAAGLVTFLTRRRGIAKF